jgi:hypothetical protein
MMERETKRENKREIERLINRKKGGESLTYPYLRRRYDRERGK